MANQTSLTSELFKFVTVNNPQLPKIETLKNGFIYDTVNKETPTEGILLEFSKNFEAGQLSAVISQAIDYLKKSDNATNEMSKELEDIFYSIEHYLLKKRTEDKKNEIIAQVDRFSNSILEEERVIWDCLYSGYILNLIQPTSLETYVFKLRVINLKKFIVLNNSINISDETFYNLITAIPVISSVLDFSTYIDKSKKSATLKRRLTDESDKDIQIWNSFYNLTMTLDKLETTPIAVKNFKKTVDQINDKGEKETVQQQDSKFIFQKSAVKKFPEFIKETLKSNGIVSTTDSDTVITKVKDALRNTFDEILTNKNPDFFAKAPEKIKELKGGKDLIDRNSEDKNNITSRDAELDRTLRTFQPIGIARLEVVKQLLKRYELSEIAHIENVLKGELKENSHRSKDTTETFVRTTKETSEQKLKDLQTTDRFELTKEVNKTINNDTNFQAGLNVSASYGPVTIGANANFSTRQSTSESNRQSFNFSKDIVERSLVNVQTKVSEERSTKTINEVEIINRHMLDNTKEDSKNITGIYRWVNKVYETQVWKYSERMMYEFIIPEPAAQLISILDKRDKNTEGGTPPKPLGNITFKDITSQNYQVYARDYNVKGIEIYPEPITISKAFEKGQVAGSPPPDPNEIYTKIDESLVIPVGYIATRITVYIEKRSRNAAQDDLSVIVAGRKIPIDSSHPTGIVNQALNPIIDSGAVQVMVNSLGTSHFVMTIRINCVPKLTLVEQWQIKTFDSILAAYQNLEAAYKSRKTSEQIGRGVNILGSNPLTNQATIKTELKKHCITMLTDEHFEFMDAIKQAGENLPEIDVLEAKQEGQLIKFLEQAFEWEQITYLFYPYFWGRKAKWHEKVDINEVDTFFKDFLQAGAARVIVPVRPAFKADVITFIQTRGNCFGGGGTIPLINNKEMLSIANELKSRYDILDEEKPELESKFEIVVPTTLVYLQEDSELPNFDNLKIES